MAVERLALVGSGEFTQSMNEVDKFLLAKTPQAKVAIIPTAAGLESYHKWIDDGKSHFSKLGAEVEGVELVTRADAEDAKMANQLKNFNFYYFSGGNPGYLLDTIRDSLAWQIILARFRAGATLVGASAGAMIMGKKVWARVYDFANHGIKKDWEPGLGLVDFGIIPHYDYILRQFSQERLKAMMVLLPKDLRIVGIDEDTAYLHVNGQWQVKGKGQIHELSQK